MNEILKKIQTIGIVPVIVLDDVNDAEPLAQALIDGGIPCAEITFRTQAAKESIRRITSSFPEMLVGAGTVLSREQADEAIESGAAFIVSPGLDPDLVSYCLEKGITVIPGCATPSDVQKAVSLGLQVVKFFPAESLGGLAMIKSMGAAFVNVKFMPTGGVNPSNLNTYLSNPKIVACGGSWMVNGNDVREKKFDSIRQATQQAVQTMLGFEMAHIGINSSNEAEAHSAADRLNTLFGFDKIAGNSSIFSTDKLEIMKEPFVGHNGHIGIGTNSIERAMAYLTRFGISFNQDTAKFDEKGNLKAIFLHEEIGGFAYHLIQK